MCQESVAIWKFHHVIDRIIKICRVLSLFFLGVMSGNYVLISWEWNIHVSMRKCCQHFISEHQHRRYIFKFSAGSANSTGAEIALKEVIKHMSIRRVQAQWARQRRLGDYTHTYAPRPQKIIRIFQKTKHNWYIWSVMNGHFSVYICIPYLRGLVWQGCVLWIHLGWSCMKQCGKKSRHGQKACACTPIWDSSWTAMKTRENGKVW